jgi:hypothetical protein
MQPVLRFALQTMEALDTPTSLSVAILMKNEEWVQLATKRVDPLSYLDFEQEKYLRDVQACSLLKKFQGFPTADVRKHHRACWESFQESEVSNARTNVLFRSIIDGVITDDAWSCRLLEFHEGVEQTVAHILGYLPDEVELRFGPGATLQDKQPLVTVPDKMTTVPTITLNARCLLPQWRRSAWAQANAHRHQECLTVRGDRFSSVPKDVTKRRSITIGPSINVAYQLGLGRAIRARLKSWGIDLNDGQDTHKQVACAASLNGEFATIDLSDASNRNARNMVRACLRRAPLWLEALETVRSQGCTFMGKFHLYEMYSGMGNGYTFEVETLIFLAIAVNAVMMDGGIPQIGRNILVYGDDILVPTKHAACVLAALRFYGHKPNPKKTFAIGSFRESCGGDFLKGVDVRPFEIENEPSEPHEYIALANQYWSLLGKLSTPSVRRRINSVRRAIIDTHVPTVARCYGPRSLGDIVIHDTEQWSTRSTDPTEKEILHRDRRWIRAWVPVPHTLPWYHWRPSVEYASALYGVDSSGPTSKQEGVTGYRRRWVPLLEARRGS